MMKCRTNLRNFGMIIALSGSLSAYGTVTFANADSLSNNANLSGNNSYISSDKGDFKFASPQAWPETTLDLSPIERQVGEAARSRCGTGLSAAPLNFGKAPSFMSKMAGKLANAAMSQLVTGLLGGGGSSGGNSEPPLKKDPIKKKYKTKFENKENKVKVRVGSRLFSDALLISADIDKSRYKGTFHTIFLEKSDCTRIWPEDTWGFRHWGKWSLSVSVTKTTRTYQNGSLVNETVDKSGWSKSGTFDHKDIIRIFGTHEDTQELALFINPNTAFLNQLKSELQTPLWQSMGYGEPTQGLRAIGAAFPGLTAEDLGDDTVAIVHVTHVEKGHYKTVGFPLKLNVAESGEISLQELPIYPD